MRMRIRNRIKIKIKMGGLGPVARILRLASQTLCVRAGQPRRLFPSPALAASRGGALGPAGFRAWKLIAATLAAWESAAPNSRSKSKSKFESESESERKPKRQSASRVLGQETQLVARCGEQQQCAHHLPFRPFKWPPAWAAHESAPAGRCERPMWPAARRLNERSARTWMGARWPARTQ